MPCHLSFLSCRGRGYCPDLKSSKQVVHLRKQPPKVQQYQAFSRLGCVLPWHTNKIFVIVYTLHFCFFPSSIAQFCRPVERNIRISSSGTFYPFHFCLAKVLDQANIPGSLIGGVAIFQDNSVLRPSSFHGLLFWPCLMRLDKRIPLNHPNYCLLLVCLPA